MEDDEFLREARRVLDHHGVVDGGIVSDTALEADLDPPAPEQVRHRAVICAAIAARCLTEVDGNARAEARAALLDWVESSGAAVELEPSEARLLTAAPGAIDEADLVDGTWQLEAAAVLAWAAGVLPELPSDRVNADPATVFGALGLPDPDATGAAFHPSEPRSIDEVAALRRELLDLHLRLLRGRDEPGGDTEEASRHRSIVGERHRSVDWLLTGGPFGTGRQDGGPSVPSRP